MDIIKRLYAYELYAAKTFGFIPNTHERRLAVRIQALETFLSIRSLKALPA